jgi:hypothetical protein
VPGVPGALVPGVPGVPVVIGAHVVSGMRI